MTAMHLNAHDLQNETILKNKKKKFHLCVVTMATSQVKQRPVIVHTLSVISLNGSTSAVYCTEWGAGAQQHYSRKQLSEPSPAHYMTDLTPVSKGIEIKFVLSSKF